jgi:hypothetical protein
MRDFYWNGICFSADSALGDHALYNRIIDPSYEEDLSLPKQMTYPKFDYLWYFVGAALLEGFAWKTRGDCVLRGQQ